MEHTLQFMKYNELCLITIYHKQLKLNKQMCSKTVYHTNTSRKKKKQYHLDNDPETYHPGISIFNLILFTLWYLVKIMTIPIKSEYKYKKEN